MAEKKKELGGRKLSMPAKIIIVLFAVIMALSMMLPSLATFFTSNSSQTTEETTEQTDAETEGTEGNDDATTDESAEATGEDASDASEEEATVDASQLAANLPACPDNDTLKSYEESYVPEAKRFEDKLAENPDDLGALLNAAQIYMNWGYAATYVSMDDADRAYAYAIVDQAIAYFDRYLALHESNAVRVDRALCLYYKDELDQAITDLEALSAEQPEYPLVWANLGMLYELKGETEKANDAYRKTAEYDANNEYGAKEYANERLIELNSTVDSPGDAGDASVDDISTAPEPGLTSTLAEDSGVGF